MNLGNATTDYFLSLACWYVSLPCWYVSLPCWNVLLCLFYCIGM